MFACPATDDFFRSRIDQMIDLRHPLAVLSSRMPWQDIEARVAHLFMRKARTAAAMPDLDLFGEAPVVVARASNAGRPRVPLRVMIALLYLKHAFNESDEGVVQRWADTPRWQFFGGWAYYEDRQPCDATTLVKFRQLLHPPDLPAIQLALLQDVGEWPVVRVHRESASVQVTPPLPHTQHHRQHFPVMHGIVHLCGRQLVRIVRTRL